MHASMPADALLLPIPTGLTDATTLARRPASIKGLAVGFLGNLKPNCDVLLHTLEGKALEMGAKSTMFREKTSCSLGAGDALLDEIAAHCQVAVVALGD